MKLWPEADAPEATFPELSAYVRQAVHDEAVRMEGDALTAILLHDGAPWDDLHWVQVADHPVPPAIACFWPRRSTP